MSKIEVDTIDKQSGSTLTLGGSGTAVTLASGATQTGFGRTGTVNWQTTAKTSGFTAANGEGYFCDTNSGAFEVILPGSPAAGSIVAFKDYRNTFATANLTLNRNSSPIDGNTENLVLNIDGQSVTIVYVDATRGWVVVNDSNVTLQQKFVSATGGTVTTVCTNFKVHTFTGPGTFTVSCAGNALGSNTVDYLVIGGGAGASGDRGGGGGAGGYRFSNGTASGCYSAGPSPLGASALPVTATGFPITVGGGGARTPPSTDAGSGNSSIFSSITSAGGGRGARQGNVAGCGGSGGGGAGIGPNSNSGAGAGNTPPTTPSQGNDGGAGNGNESGPVRRGGGGGGGAGAVGTTATTSQVGNGGNGLASTITGTPTTRAGGGGGGGSGGSFSPGGSGGSGGAGDAGSSGDGGNATCNTGSGGGGGCGATSNTGGNGGSGVVIIRYKFQ